MNFIFKIGEFSRLTQVSARMLRYYDEAGLLKPEATDPYTGYRLYSSPQIQKLNQIVFLRDIGFNVAEIAAVINNWDEEFIKSELLRKQEEIEHAISLEQEKISRISMTLEDLGRVKAPFHYDVVIKSIPAYKVISLRKKIDNYFAEGELWHELSEKLGSLEIPQNNLNIALYYDQEYKEKDVDVQVCATVPSFGKQIEGLEYCTLEPVPYMACVMVQGEFKNIGPAFHSVANWISRHHQYCLSSLPNRQICHRGPWNEENPDNYLVEIQIAIEKKRG